MPDFTESETRTARYARMGKEDTPQQRCAVCEMTGNKGNMDRHHPRGRHGDNLFHYIYVHRICHQMIHDDPKWATENGWLESNR